MTIINNKYSAIIRFNGVLDEKQNFTRFPGFTIDEHTEKAAKGKSSYRVVLLDQSKKVLFSFFPEIDFESEGCIEEGELRTSIVEADIPLKPGGETIALLFDGKTIYEEKVIKGVPQLEKITLEQFRRRKIPEPEMGDFGFAVAIDTEGAKAMKDAKLMAVNWKVTDSNKDLHVDILLLGDSGIYGEVATDLIKGPFVMDMAGLSSSYNYVVVRASNGFQSTTMASKKIPTKTLPPRLDIIEPKDGSGIQAHTPFDLRATIHDLAVKNPEKNLVWSINGKIIQRGGNLAMASSLKPGKYRIEALYQYENRKAKSQIYIVVKQPDKAYDKWLKEAERF
jgi:hypothetical protein